MLGTSLGPSVEKENVLAERVREGKNLPIVKQHSYDLKYLMT